MPTANAPFSLLLLTFLLITTPLPSTSLPFAQYQTLLSLSHSLTTRVAILRASRGDVEGSARARKVAQQLERGLGLGFYGLIWTMGWDYLKNYAWRDATTSFEMLSSLPDLNELMRAVNELTRLESQMERVAWLHRNYKDALRVSKSLFGRLLKVFSQSGPLRGVVEAMQREVVEGDLLRDFLEVGSNDLKGLIQIYKNIALQFSPTADRTDL
ncbi:unnamed protein product [Ilex paraguariensis]|uniref:Uncharacterized protein n=1 Tax=Ilex paraguariensis TaxID=185542 RepID=A0ABC8SC06_9AQUA